MKLIFLGAPGVGKGTYASRVGPHFGIPQVSTGDLVRTEIKAGTPLGQRMKQVVDAGGLVDDATITEMLKNRLAQPDAEKGFILYGYPRTIPQAKALEAFAPPEFVLNINLAENIIIQKIAARRVCKSCGNIYNLADIRVGELHMPPLLPKKEGVCDKCGDQLYQRVDDKEATVKERLEVYKKQTQPLIDYYKEKAILYNIQIIGGPDKMVPKIIEVIKEELGE